MLSAIKSLAVAYLAGCLVVGVAATPSPAANAEAEARLGVVNAQSAADGIYKLGKRAGPSGTLIKPAGNDWVYTEVSWPGSGFRFIYQPLYQRSRDSACANHRQTCWAATTWLEVALVSVTEPGKVFKLADYLHASLDNPAANIDTWLGVPVEAACGDYRVRVIEHQRYFDQWISFQSAAPLIHMQCVRYAGPTK